MGEAASSARSGMVQSEACSFVTCGCARCRLYTPIYMCARWRPGSRHSSWMRASGMPMWVRKRAERMQQRVMPRYLSRPSLCRADEACSNTTGLVGSDAGKRKDNTLRQSYSLTTPTLQRDSQYTTRKASMGAVGCEDRGCRTAAGACELSSPPIIRAFQGKARLPLTAGRAKRFGRKFNSTRASVHSTSLHTLHVRMKA